MRENSLTAVLIFLLTTLSIFISGAYGFVIVESGQPKAVIVLSKTASDDDKSAAQELQSYIRKISGGDVAIQDDESSIRANMVHIGVNKHVKKFGIDLSDIGPEGFKIKTIGNNLVLAGNEPHGTEYAVYTFLEKCLGVRWFWPGELGEVVPHSETIKVDAIDFKDEPDYKMRCVGGEEIRAAKPTLWGLRNKRGGSFWIKLWSSFNEMVPPEKYAEQHPEYYSLIDGKRRASKYSQLCTTNPEVIKICVDYISDYFDEHREYDAFTIEENDWKVFCECDKCRALDSGEKLVPFQSEIPYAEPPFAPGNFGPGFVISDRMFTFANAVAEGLAETQPDRYVSMSSYSWHVPLPKKIKELHKNLIVQTTTSCMGYWYEPRQQKDYAELAKWAQVADKICIYEYYHNAAWPNMFRLFPTLAARSIADYYRLGARYFFTQSAGDYAINGLNYYVATKAAWDTSLDVKDVLEDFYSKAFGAAREPMKKYFEMLEQAWKDATIEGDLYRAQRHQGIGRAYEHFLAILKPGVLERCGSYLDQAEKLADSDIVKKRIDFMWLGFRYNDLGIKGIRAIKKLEALGYPKFYQYRLSGPIKYPIDEAKAAAKYIDRQQTRRYLAEAIDIWRQRAEFVERIRGQGAVEFRYYKREFDPSDILKELQRHVETLDEG